MYPALLVAQDKDVVIRVVQDDESSRLDNFETNLLLKRSSFKFQILLNNVEGIYVFASIRDSVYRFTENSPIRDFEYLNLLELRDGDKNNSNKELNLSETGWSYWFYKDSAEWHSFNKKSIGLGERGIVCTKAIRQFYDVPTNKVMKMRNMEAPLYLYFVAVKEYDKDGKPLIELMRRKVRIEWTDED
jgi:hypothetical protein